MTEDKKVEGTIIGMVIIYAVMICIDLAVPEIMYTLEGGKFTQHYQNFAIDWMRTFWMIDCIFLGVFMVRSERRPRPWP